MIDRSLKCRIEKLLEIGESFAAVRLPGEDVVLLVGDSLSNFSVTPWIGGNYSRMPVETPTPEDIYREQLSTLIERLKSRGGKTVLSRVIGVRNNSVNWTDVAENLWELFPDTFGYLFFTPHTGAWLGASPEILMKTFLDGSFTTHALAGTLHINDEWDEKNKNEQHLVEEYIESVLRNFGCTFEKDGPKSLRYGNLKHLSTVYNGFFPDGCDSGAILKELAPTPALAGFPKSQALEDIASLERHDRQCYGGYITLKTDNGSFSFVTIRCIHFDPTSGKGAIYVGGGITPQSDVSAEMKETSVKASPILEIISRLQN